MLDNNGWGLREMILLSSIILIALFTATFFVISMYSQLDKSLQESHEAYEKEFVNEEREDDQQVIENDPEDIFLNSTYLEYEEQLRQGALSYAKDCNCFADAEFVRVEFIELLKLSYIEPMEDIDHSLCSGYVDVYPQNDEDYLVDSYLKCNNYVTEGYNE